MSARGRMTMRAVLTRATDAGEDDWGQPAKAAQSWPVIDPAMPCFAWIGRRESVDDEGARVYTAEFRAIFPEAADIREGDHVSDIQNRRGEAIGRMAGVFEVETLAPSIGRTDATLRRVDGGT